MGVVEEVNNIKSNEILFDTQPQQVSNRAEKEGCTTTREQWYSDISSGQ